jgi:hypothetical protein
MSMPARRCCAMSLSTQRCCGLHCQFSAHRLRIRTCASAIHWRQSEAVATQPYFQFVQPTAEVRCCPLLYIASAAVLSIELALAEQLLCHCGWCHAIPQVATPALLAESTRTAGLTQQPCHLLSPPEQPALGQLLRPVLTGRVSASELCMQCCCAAGSASTPASFSASSTLTCHA